MVLHGHSNYLRKPCLECRSPVPNHHTTVRKSRGYGKCQHSMHVLSDVYFCDWARYGCLALRGTRIWVPVSQHWSGQLSASRNEDARTETIEWGSEAPKESAKGACDDGWGSEMQDWDGEEQDVTKSNGFFPSLTGTVVVAAAVMLAGVRIIGAYHSKKSLPITDSVPAHVTVSDLEKPANHSCSDTQQSQKECDQVLEPSPRNDADSSDIAVVDRVSESAAGLQAHDPNIAGDAPTEEMAPTGFEGMVSTDEWTVLEDDSGGSSEIVGQSTTADWTGDSMKESTPVEEIRVPSTLAPAEENQIPAIGIDPNLSSRQALPVRERAQLAVRAAAAASEAAQRAAAYSAAASSAASSAAAAAEKATTAAGAAQIALERRVEEAVQEAEARVARATEIAEQAESHAANMAAMEKGYQDPEGSEAEFMHDDTESYAAADWGTTQQWKHWWMSLWHRFTTSCSGFGAVVITWFMQAWLAVRQACVWAAGEIRDFISKCIRRFGEG